MKIRKDKIKSLIILGFFLLQITAFSQTSYEVRDHYIKLDTMIPMRDGVKLYTIIYLPRDEVGSYPILMNRTPYSAGPYGKENYPSRQGPNINLMKEGYIFVNQDVRGRYMSEGHNLEVTPHLDLKRTVADVDESSDTYDSIEFLLKLLKNHNGRVGLSGISYPGFYATASLPDAHPAIKAVSPQAPVTDEFIGDDVNHKGAFFLLDNFNFINYFGVPRSGPLPDYGGALSDTSYTDAYKFFLELGPIKNTQSKFLFNHKSYIWNEYLAHDTYDEYWRARNIRPHLKNIKVPTLVVGGWFDAEDCFGALNTYQAIEQQNKNNVNHLVIGPWTHGAWSAGEWSQFGSLNFESNTSKYFQDSIETVFFNYFLKDKGLWNLAEARVFETGGNQWQSFTSWPPVNKQLISFYLTHESGPGSLSNLPVKSTSSFKSFTSDPDHPVPYTSKIQRNRNNQYMIEDQRFASKRSDVLSWSTVPLSEDQVFSGPIQAEIYAATSGSDMDLIVKVIDVDKDSTNIPGSGAERLIRAEVIRGKFRKDFSKPIQFKKNKPDLISFTLPDIHHRFKQGHRLMVQIQSSWFPLVDRNPQQFITIPSAEAKDFKKAEIRIYGDKKRPSRVILGRLE